MDFQLFKDHREFFGRYRLLNEKDGYAYSDLISVYMLDLNALDIATPEDEKSGLVTWARIFKASTWDEIKLITKDHPAMKGVAESMYEAVTDKETYQQIRAHEKDMLDRQAMIAYAETEGKAKGEAIGEARGEARGKIIERIDTTMKKINKGKTLPEIADALERTEEDIRPIYEVIAQHRDITDPDKLYEILLKNKEEAR